MIVKMMLARVNQEALREAVGAVAGQVAEDADPSQVIDDVFDAFVPEEKAESVAKKFFGFARLAGPRGWDGIVRDVLGAAGIGKDDEAAKVLLSDKGRRFWAGVVGVAKSVGTEPEPEPDAADLPAEAPADA